MTVKKVTSKNADYQKFEVLKTNRNKRHRYGEFFVEGVRNLNQAAAHGWEISAWLTSPQRELSRWAKELMEQNPAPVRYELAPELLEELSGKEETSELMAVVKMRPDDFRRLDSDKAAPLYVLFDRPSNRGNLGTLIRSMDSLGADGLILTGHGVDLYDPEVVGATMGSFFHIPAVHAESNEAVFEWIARQKEQRPGFTVVGTTAHKQHPLWGQDLTGPVLLMIGNETDGLAYGFKEGCDVLCTIPMAQDSTASSFNVACAATVMLYETVRQREERER